MIILLEAYLVGFILGGVFAFLRLPIPAPTNLAGILGIVGIFIGYLIFKH